MGAWRRLGSVAGALSLKLLTFSFLFFSFFLLLCVLLPPPPSQGTQRVGKRQIPSPGSSGKFQEIGLAPSISWGMMPLLHWAEWAQGCSFQSRICPFFAKKTPCLWKSGGFSLHRIMSVLLLEMLAILLSFQEDFWMPHPWKCSLDRCLCALPAGFSPWGLILLCFSPVLPKSCFSNCP